VRGGTEYRLTSQAARDLLPASGDTNGVNVARKRDIEKLLGPVPGTKLDRSLSWLQDRRRERARKSVRRRVKKALQNLWDIETRLVSEGLAFTPVHQSLMKVIEALNSFVDDYDQK
jgi:hypothetical protein